MATTDNGADYYKYMLIYVDNVLHLANDAQEDMLKLNQVYGLKEGFGPPSIYLRDNVDKFKLEYGRNVWYMARIEYLRGDIKKVDSILEGDKAALKSFRDGNFPYPSI